MEHLVTEDEDNLRADRIVKNLSSNVGYVFLQKLFRLGKIKVNGKNAAPSDRVHVGDMVEIFANLGKTHESNSRFGRKLFDSLKSMIIYENEDFFAINKPTKLAVQLGTKVSICIETFIKSYPGCECRLVHRLDKDTSGVLLIAKNQQTARKLTELFRENRIKKTYLAIVDGKVHQSGVIDNFLKKSLMGNEEKIRIFDFGQRAITAYKPIKIVKGCTLLELRPLTGRKHQLRVHCTEVLNAPILGDRKYNPNFRHEELFLHAYKIFIEDWEVEISAEIPEYFTQELL
jgi:23S rRNA pseudouridine955/2504/2580 synthase